MGLQAGRGCDIVVEPGYWHACTLPLKTTAVAGSTHGMMHRAGLAEDCGRKHSKHHARPLKPAFREDWS